MARRERFIDHEEYKLKVKLSMSTNLVLQQDMFRFGYLKSNEKLNPNLFINHLIPIMFQYRERLNEKFLRCLNKQITEKDEEVTIFFNEITEIANNVFYEDYDSIHKEVKNLRIAKQNMRLFNGNDKKTSTFIRSLINQYCNLQLDWREFLFFNEEYNLISKAFNNSFKITFLQNNESIELYPLFFNVSPIDSELYVFGLYYENDNVYIKSYKLCEIEQIKVINIAYIPTLSEQSEDSINKYIIDLEYLETNYKLIGGNLNGNL